LSPAKQISFDIGLSESENEYIDRPWSATQIF
jgi:hypothetical protein